MVKSILTIGLALLYFLPALAMVIIIIMVFLQLLFDLISSDDC
jgi:hypothetical protein